ncbi:MAG TPA: YihA family ribosome biogenesis GTP-binding protein [Alphaproteobacteria bacterium]|nr:YihA family ribosome biogenesis GTP-binding protein [Alphaproteobacteria bacterium]
MVSLPEFDDTACEAGRLLFAQSCDFVMGAVDMRHLPAPDLPEIAFAGRSNVGKSSLINALTNRKTLARTSNTPGRTQEINFFNLAGRLMLADLPGYGYARVSRTQVERWTRLINQYLKGRPNLRRACVLIDSRHGLKDSDIAVMKMLDVAAVSYQIVLTKADKPKAAELTAQIERVRKAMRAHVAAHPEIHVTSAAKGTGIAELRAALAELALPAPL